MRSAPIDLIRPSVRGERAYKVPTTTDAEAKLDQNESPYDLPEELKRAATERFIASPWNRYPDDRPHRLIAALSDRLGVSPDSIIVGRGSNEIAQTLGLCFLCAGTPVVLPDPMFALYGSVARMHGADVIRVGPQDDLSHDVEAILTAARASNAPLTIVTTPNNPTGQSISFEGLRTLAEGVPGALVIDEAYHEFVDGPTGIDLIAEFPNVLVTRTFSKAMGLAGMRIGYMVGAPEMIAEIEKARIPFLVDRLSEEVALEILARPDLVTERVAQLTAERESLVASLGDMEKVELRSGVANFVLIRTPLPVAELLAALEGLGIRIRNVSSYTDLAARDGKNGWARVTVGTPNENEAFLAAIGTVLASAIK